VATANRAYVGYAVTDTENELLAVELTRQEARQTAIALKAPVSRVRRCKVILFDS
jgi:hypothetical protein